MQLVSNYPKNLLISKFDPYITIVPERPNFPKEEEKVLKFWTEIKAFEKQLELSKGKPSFTFYDGPPFATGLPHYGHIAAGTIKVSDGISLQKFLGRKKSVSVL